MAKANAEIASRFGVNLRRCRKRAGLSQEQVAIRAALHRTEISLLERGERCPKLDTAIKVATAANADLGELLHGICWIPGDEIPGEFSLIG